MLSYLEQIDVAPKADDEGFVMPVQRVCRPNHTFRGFMGQIEKGSLSVDDEIISLPQNEKAKVTQILVGDKDVNTAIAGQPVNISIDKEIDISRGCVLTKSDKLKIADMFTATILWMDNEELVPGRNYLIKCGTKILPATVMEIKVQS